MGQKFPEAVKDLSWVCAEKHLSKRMHRGGNPVLSLHLTSKNSEGLEHLHLVPQLHAVPVPQYPSKVSH